MAYFFQFPKLTVLGGRLNIAILSTLRQGAQRYLLALTSV